MARERPPSILEIFRDFVKPGSEAAYRAVEEDAARICAEMRFPHHHLALESVSGPTEVWWLNGFDSQADIQQVTDGYKKNAALVAALGEITRRREPLVQTSVDLFAAHRADLGGGARWRIAGARFFVVTVSGENRPREGSVFEAPDGTRFAFRPAATRREADGLAAAAGPEARIFAVRPYWGMPAPEWIAADPGFWKANPMARAVRD
jgi:hypothetical protein